MKFCTKCGTQLNDDSCFCISCGSQAPLPNFQEKIIDSTNNNNEISNANCESNNTNKILMFKRIFLNHKKIITITMAILCIVIIGIVCLKKIPYKCLDIKEAELINILNDYDVYAANSPLDLDGFAADVTTYKISYEGENGVLALSHSSSNHIRCIMITMEDTIHALAIISAIASELDYSFYTANVINSLLENGIYSSNKYSIKIVNLSSELSGVVLAPKEHFDYCVKSIFDN